MAANQTIIQAAGQRYAPIKTDYSGYIQGLASVATALVNKSKSVREDKAGLNKLKEGAQTDITPWGDTIKHYIDNHPDSTATKGVNVEKMKKGTLRLEDLQSKLGGMLDPDGPGLSSSIDAITANYLYSYANGDFNETFYVTQPVYNEFGEQTGTEQKEFNMNFIPEDPSRGNFSPLVMGPKGEYITMDEFENLLNVALPGDAVSVTELLREFPNSTGVKEYKDESAPSDKVFNNVKDSYLDEIKEIFKLGSKDAQGNPVSGKNVMMSFMFDSSITVDGEDQTFVKWYLNKPGLIPDELLEMYNKTFRGDEEKGIIGKFEQLSGEEEKAMLNMLAQDLIKYDPNIEEDLMTYIKDTLEKNRIN
jgi:hypothetical protein